MAFSGVGKVLSGYQSGFDLVSGKHPDAIERFVVVRSRGGTPRLMLPAEKPAMRAAMQCFLGSRRGAGLVSQFAPMAARLSSVLASESQDVSLTSEAGAQSPLRELIASVLGRNDFQIALRLSFGRPNAKLVAIAISDAGEALGFAKFGSEAMTNDLVAHESAILEKYENSDIPLVLPKRLFSGTWAGGHNVLITSPLEFKSLNRDAYSAHQAADAFAVLNLESNSKLSTSAYWKEIAQRVDNFNDNDNEFLVDTVAKIEQRWGDQALDFGASHGDWTRANLGLVGGKVAALDWERCTMLAPRGVDIAHFAIAEKSFSRFSKSVDVEQVAQNVRQYLKAADLSPDNAELLVVSALLEMVIRFKSAQNVGLRATDSKFGSALRACLQKWAA